MRSLGEIEHTCRKAAKGCGLPWGIADEVGKAIRWLHVYGFDGVTSLCGLFEEYDHHHHLDYAPQSLEGIWTSQRGVLSPIMAGISLCDCINTMAERTITVGPIAWPLITAGFLGQTALTSDQSVALKWSSVTMQLNRDVLVVTGNTEDIDMKLVGQISYTQISISADTKDIPMNIGDAEVNLKSWKQLEIYAHRTYVEASEASRLAGAGAGLNDND